MGGHMDTAAFRWGHGPAARGVREGDFTLPLSLGERPVATVVSVPCRPWAVPGDFRWGGSG